MMAVWLLLISMLLIASVWDACVKWGALDHGIKALASRLDETEARNREAQEQIWQLICKLSAMQHRVEACDARLDTVEESIDASSEVRKAVRDFISSFEHSAAE
jgi:chromosome segregation ATPase